ncbi:MULTISPECIES: patatin-like phospholipase family protein [unclassified Shewanella]|uniref:patatin-like phospholipase family protein n=1 Tax=unclassified Shewanella TaxID=196818 RepID=UPI000C32CB28|nr:MULTISPECIES: patatin-like phospholipase family protein [unclassified Shewanella]MBB1363642.1 patatin-like phospholipase family protein [Shewanella sp. SR44-4]MBO1897024.1 patatin-like phospholipase family protein [Shewanella sp. BF02_Schw]PKH31989.1 patatin [Shewanella sp. ALD9]QHS14268.1 patatin-like phospholipase family protein [Shewanella sp. Arc9-LZ]
MPVSTALVLGGGGARAAYQIGVLKALVQFYPRNHNVPFDIICGTSAGAINAISIATHASCFHLAIKKLDWVWRHFETHKVYRTSIPQVLRHLGRMAIKGLQDDKVNTDAGSLLDNQPLRELLNNLIDFKRIDRNIGNDALKAISIDSSCYNNSRSYTFYQGNEHIDDWQRARRVGIRSLLNTEHLLASSAIPMVFPSIKLNQAYYGDGSVHQLSPLSSPIHLGASKIFVINLDSPHKHFPIEFEYHPKTATIAGHLLDTIFSDTLNSDLERLQRVNSTLSMISPQDRETLNLRHIDTLVIKPSQDLSRIAERFYDDMPFAIRTLLKLFGINRQSDSSIVSYLLFEKSYTTTLIDLGYQDAMDRIDEIKQFFDIQTKV